MHIYWSIVFVGPLLRVPHWCNGKPLERGGSYTGEMMLCSGLNNMFVRLGTDYKIRNGGYFESIKNSADQFISKP